jgi:hypothetical protein
MTTGGDLDDLPTPELAALARSALAALGRRGDQAAFAELLSMNGHVGSCLGEAARSLAATGSWAQVGDVSGTTRQAAWSRWKG